MEEGKTLVIILHFGAIDDTLQCLDSLRETVRLPFDVFIVNNGPEKDVEAVVRARHPEIIYEAAGLETGFAAGNNIGLRHSQARGYRYSLLLNNDTVAEHDFLSPLVGVLQRDPTIAMAGPAIFHYDDKKQLWSCGGWMNRWSGSMGGARTLKHIQGEFSEVDYLPGACILVRNDVLPQIGLLSEDYFLGVEEADWACNARRAGFRVVARPHSILLHKVGMSSRWTPEFIYNSFRNRFLFLRRQFPFPLRSLLIAIVLVRNLVTTRARRRALCLRAFVDHCRLPQIRRRDLDTIKAEYAGSFDQTPA